MVIMIDIVGMVDVLGIVSMINMITIMSNVNTTDILPILTIIVTASIVYAILIIDTINGHKKHNQPRPCQASVSSRSVSVARAFRKRSPRQWTCGTSTESPLATDGTGPTGRYAPPHSEADPGGL